jgi:CO/xanthine dehydrogenase Mo-binding subunit
LSDIQGYANVGRSLPKFEAVHKATGALRFTGDIAFPRMLSGRVLRSPHAHARVKSIELARALAIPGVKAIITHKDVPKHQYGREFALPPEYMVRDNFILEEKARYVGDRIAAVAATSDAAAEEALAAIEVDYEELPAVFDPLEAITPGAPSIHEVVFWGKRRAEVENNLLAKVFMEIGDVDEGFRESDLVVENDYEVGKQQQTAIERRCCTVKPEPDGRLSVWSTTQSIHGLRHNLATALGIPFGRLKVHRTFLGGGFGSRLDMNIDEPIAAMLAMKTGLPVRLQLSRAEDLISTSRHPARMRLKTGVKRDGTIVAHEMVAHVDTGAYGVSGEWVTKCMGGWFMSMYRAEHQRYTGSVIYTNTPPAAAFRGFGNPQANFAVESQIDIVAEELGLDPLEIRLKNHFREGDLFYGQGPNVQDHIRSCGVEELLTRGAELIGWHRRKELRKQDGPIRRGIGVARAFHTSGCGSPNEVSDIIEYSGSIVKLNEDGTANLITALVDMGTGNLTGQAQIVAEELGLRAEEVIVSEADTDVAPYDVVTHASRSTYAAGAVAKAAAANAKRVMLEMAAKLLEVAPEDLEVREGYVHTKGAPERRITVGDVARTAQMRQWGTIMGESSFRATTCPPHFTAKFVEVAVDTETGEVSVEKVVAGADVGQPINPLLVEGQLHGGIQQGFGYALMEAIHIDETSGQPLNLDFLNYKILTARDAPARVEVFLADTVEETGPFGAKGIGESATNDAASALANAIAHAIGVHIKDLPITPEKILRALSSTAGT